MVVSPDRPQQLLRLDDSRAAVRRHEAIQDDDVLRRPAAAQQQGEQAPRQALRKLGELNIVAFTIRMGLAGFNMR